MKRPLRTLASLASSSLLLSSQAFFWIPIAEAQTLAPDPANGCPTGTKEATSAQNPIANPNFAINAGTGNGVITGPGFVPAGLGFSSDLPYRGDVVYPIDPIGGLSIQDANVNGGTIPLAPGVINGRGVTAEEASRLGVDPISTYLYSNPNASAATPGTPGSAFTGKPIVWRQQTVPVRGATTYNFKAAFFNLLVNTGAPGSNGVPPAIILFVGPPGGPFIQSPQPFLVGNPNTFTNLPADAVPGFPGVVNSRQAWIPVQISFTTAANQTQIELQIVDIAQNVTGDDFGLTAINLKECSPNIGVAKSAGTPIDNGNGTFTIPYTVRVRNLAPVPIKGQPQNTYDLRNVQLTDSLTNLAAKATINSITAIQSPTLAVNTAYSGSTNPTLLLGTDILRPQTTAVVSFNVILTPGSGPEGFGPYNNTVKATAVSQGGSPVSKDSTDGGDPDPSGTNTETGSTPTVVRLGGVANILLVKRITNLARNGATLGGVNFGGFVDDPNTTDDNNPGWTQLLATASPVGVPALDVSTPVIPGDEVEYTVYFLSNGSTAILATNVCDLIPSGTSLVPSTTQVQSGTTPASSSGTVFTPLAPLPPNNSCLNQSNPNGAVIFNLSDLPNTPAGNVGFVRFRVRIN